MLCSLNGAADAPQQLLRVAVAPGVAGEVPGEGLDEVETGRGPGLVHRQHRALAEHVGHQLQPLQGTVGHDHGPGFDPFPGGGVDADLQRLDLRRGIRLLDQRPELAEELALFQGGHVEQHHRAVAKEHGDSAGPRRQGYRIDR